MNKFRIFCFSTLMILVLSTAANAGTIGTIDLGPSTAAWTSPTTIIGGGYTAENPGYVRAGLYAITPSNGTGAGLGVANYAFCIDIPQPPVAGPYLVKDLQDAPLPENIPLGTPMTEAQADLIRELWAENFDISWTEGGLENKQLAEAFGVALWEIVYETSGTLDITNGAFSATNVEQAALANEWLANLADEGGEKADIVALSSLTGQDFVTVPEPATMAILALGGLGLFRRKKS